MAKQLAKKGKKEEAPKKEPSIVVKAKVAHLPKKPEMKGKAQDVMKGLLEQFGDNIVVPASDLVQYNYGRISTGSIALDLWTGGGHPIGRMIEVAGFESVGKSTLACHSIREAQQTQIEWEWQRRYIENRTMKAESHTRKVDGLLCGYVDVEGTQDDEWLESIGVDTDSLIYAQTEGMEQSLEVVKGMIKAGVKFIVLDSIDAMIPTKDYDKAFGDSSAIGLKARLLGDICRIVTNLNNGFTRRGELPCTVLLLNQLREKPMSMGDPVYATGGNARKFYMSMMIRLREKELIKEGTGKDAMTVGKTVAFKITKNKKGQQYAVGTFDLYFLETEEFTQGAIDNLKAIVMEGLTWGALERAGSWMRWHGENIAQGAEKAVEYFRNNTDKFEQLKAELIAITTTSEPPVLEIEEEE